MMDYAGFAGHLGDVGQPRLDNELLDIGTTEAERRAGVQHRQIENQLDVVTVARVDAESRSRYDGHYVTAVGVTLFDICEHGQISIRSWESNFRFSAFV
jgi:hypothetical protein